MQSHPQGTAAATLDPSSTRFFCLQVVVENKQNKEPPWPSGCMSLDTSLPCMDCNPDEAADAYIAENVSNGEFLAQSQPAACLQPQELCEMTPAVPQLVSSSTELLHFSSSAVLSSDISMDITTSQASENRVGCGCLAASAPDPETNSKVSLMYLC